MFTRHESCNDGTVSLYFKSTSSLPYDLNVIDVIKTYQIKIYSYQNIKPKQI